MIAKFILTIIMVLLALPLWAGGIMMVGGGTPAAAGLTCTNGNGDSSLASNSTGEASENITDAQQRAQQFTFSVKTRITKIVLPVYDENNTGNLVLEIRADNGSNLPTGSALATVTLAAADVAPTTFTETDFVLSTPWEATANTLYHIVIYGSGTNPYFHWETANSGNPYAGGAFSYSTDSGANFTSLSTYDFRFNIYGCQ